MNEPCLLKNTKKTPSACCNSSEHLCSITHLWTPQLKKNHSWNGLSSRHHKVSPATDKLDGASEAASQAQFKSLKWVREHVRGRHSPLHHRPTVFKAKHWSVSVSVFEWRLSQNMAGPLLFLYMCQCVFVHMCVRIKKKKDAPVHLLINSHTLFIILKRTTDLHKEAL